MHERGPLGDESNEESPGGPRVRSSGTAGTVSLDERRAERLAQQQAEQVKAIQEMLEKAAQMILSSPQDAGEPSKPERPRGGAARRASLRAVPEDGTGDEEEVARTVALNQLNHCARSRAELAAAMSRKGVSGPVAERVLDRFEEVGLINDVQYAEMLVRTRRKERGLARRALADELHRKGVDKHIADEVLAGLEPEDERAMARNLVERKARSWVGLDHEKRRRRLVGLLARKGYSPSLALRVVDEVLSDEPDGTQNT